MGLWPGGGNSWRQLQGGAMLFLASAGLALVVWFVITDSENQTIEERLGFGLPVVAVNVPTDLAVANQVPPVLITIFGREDDVLDASADDFEATVDLTGLPEGTHQLPVRVQSRQDDIRVRAVLPETVEVTLEAVVQRVVPVRVVLSNLPPIGFTVGDPEVAPSTVTVTGVQQLVDLVEAVVAPVDLATATVDVSRAVSLQARTAAGAVVSRVLLEPDTVEVRVAVQQEVFRRVAVISPRLAGQPAEGYRVVSVSVDPPTVDILATLDALERLTTIDTNAVVIQGATDTLERIVRVSPPEGISLAEDRPVTVRVSVEPIEVTASVELFMTIEGLDESLNAVVSPSRVNVTLRGPAPLLSELGNEAAFASIDLTGLTTGEHTVPVTVTTAEELEIVATGPDSVDVLIVAGQDSATVDG